MGLLEILFLGIALSMDAFAVSVCKGLSMKKMQWKKVAVIALYFGAFQALMPIIGYFLGAAFRDIVESVDHWIAFFLLALIGIKMIWDALHPEENAQTDKTDAKTMLLLAVATSIDALAVGITFAFLKTNILLAAFLIGMTTFVISFCGVKIGNRFGDRFEKHAALLGGVILILIGLKILLEHLGLFPF